MNLKPYAIPNYRDALTIIYRYICLHSASNQMQFLFKFFFVHVLCIFSLPIFAQSKKELKFETITINDGLSQGMINAMLQDKYGFMWFATNDGLNRFDGYHFTIFKNSVDDSNSIAGNFIRFLFEDSKGRLWIATADNGLDLFDSKSETFIHFKKQNNNKNSLSSNSITSISEDKLGGIWVGTINGLNNIQITPKKETDSEIDYHDFYKQHDITITKVIFDNQHPDQEYFKRDNNCPLADWRASNFYIDNFGVIWVSVKESLFQISISKNNIFNIKKLDIENYLPSKKNNSFLEKYIQGFIPIPNSNRFLMLFSTGITEVNTDNHSMRSLYGNNIERLVYTSPNTIDENGNLWTGLENKLQRFNINNKQWNDISNFDKNATQQLDFISCSFKDKTGNIWLGTQGYGLLKYNNRFEKFHTTDNISINQMVSGNKENVLIIKNPMEELFFNFDYLNNFYTAPINKAKFVFQKSTIHNTAKTKSILQDEDGSYWIGRIGLYHYEPKSNTTSYYWDHYDDVFPLYDDRNGNLWFGNTNGIVCFDKQKKISQEYKFPVTSTDGPYDFLQAISKGNDELIWLGTLKGLYSFNPKNQKWVHYKNIPGDMTSLSYDLIFCICPDPIEPNRYLWIGTKGGGLNKFDIQTGNCKRLGSKDGLPNDVIYGIVTDADKDLWMSTNNGISRYNIKNNTFTNFNEKDGLQGNEFNRNAFCKTSNNMIFFGGLKGFNYFNPRELGKNKFAPNVAFTKIVIDGKEENVHDKNSNIKLPAYLIKSIELPYIHNDIRFEFASLDFTSLRNNKYKYKLEGFDKDWISSGTENFANYTNLNPDTYTFLVKGSNSDGIFNETATEITIIILPPYYMTWWFRVLGLFVIVFILYAIYRNRINNIMAMQEIRNSIAKDLHDDVGANLSTITILAEVAGRPSKSAEDIKMLLKKIINYARSSQESMSDIVWMVNANNDQYDNIITRMHTVSIELLESNGIEVDFKNIDDDNVKILNAKQRKAIYLIYKETLHNIVKYAQAKNVSILITKKNNEVFLEIKDNGVGFKVDEIYNKSNRGGNGIRNIKMRTKELNGTLKMISDVNKGTTVSLRFSI